VSPRLPLSIAAAAGAALLGRAGMAQRQEDLTIAVGECVGIEDSLERFACYERLVDEAQGAENAEAPGKVTGTTERESSGQAEAAATAAAPTPQTRSVAASGEDFGLSTTGKGEREPPPEIRGLVAALEESLPNRLTVTLENGQVWRQTQSQRFNLRVGHHVRIYGTRWGDAYRLSADEIRGFIQVERVR